MTEDIDMQALTSAYWRREPTGEANIYSDQGPQYASRQFRKLLASYNVKPSMSLRGICHDNAVAESFFSHIKKDKI